MVQDWGGPIGPCTAVEDIDRYRRLFILNTWLHDDTFEYSDGVRFWPALAIDPEQLGGDMPVGQIASNAITRPGHDGALLARAFDAPFPDAASKAGARRFPFCIPFAEPELGDADVHAQARAKLRVATLPIHIVFGDADPIFDWAWAEQWAGELRGSTLDRIEGAGHFLQIDAPGDVLAVIRNHAGGWRPEPTVHADRYGCDPHRINPGGTTLDAAGAGPCTGQADRPHLQPRLRVLLLPVEGGPLTRVTGSGRPRTCWPSTCANTSGPRPTGRSSWRGRAVSRP